MNKINKARKKDPTQIILTVQSESYIQASQVVP